MKFLHPSFYPLLPELGVTGVSWSLAIYGRRRCDTPGESPVRRWAFTTTKHQNSSQMWLSGPLSEASTDVPTPRLQWPALRCVYDTVTGCVGSGRGGEIQCDASGGGVEEAETGDKGGGVGVWVGGLSHSESETEPVVWACGRESSDLRLGSGAAPVQRWEDEAREAKHICPAVAAGAWWVSQRRMKRDSRRWKFLLCFRAEPADWSGHHEDTKSFQKLETCKKGGNKWVTQFREIKSDSISQLC